MADERDRLIAQPVAQAVVIETMKNARRAIAAAHGEHHVRQTTRRIGEPVQIGRALAVGAAKTLETAPRGIDVFKLVPLSFQPADAALDSRRIVRIARRRDQIDGA